jgi:LmbE family N-acetylglucosaminyl deacetylase
MTRKRWIFVVAVLLVLPATAMAQPETPVDEWKGKTILLIGAHPDDDSMSQGTLAMLKENGNDVWVVLITTGNVGTQDPDLSRFELATIRRQEELAALADVGIPEDRYINLGYDDGLLEFQDEKEVVEKIVRLIRTIRPDVLFSFDPGPTYRRWHKSDHRAASYLTADATRVAMWRLLFEGQIIHEGLKAHRIPEFMFYDSPEEAINTWVDISEYAELKARARTRYVSQFGPGWDKYEGPDRTPEEQAAAEKQALEGMKKTDGKYVEGFRYYKGFPDSMGK